MYLIEVFDSAGELYLDARRRTLGEAREFAAGWPNCWTVRVVRLW